MKKYILLASMTLFLAACGTQTRPIVAPVTPTVDDTKTQPETVLPEAENPTSAPKETLNPGTKTPTPTAPTPSAKSYTAAEVATHSNASSCWLILDGRVFDVTKFIPNHPGGDAILRGCGKDATQMFSGHPASAKAMKEQFYIGDLKS